MHVNHMKFSLCFSATLKEASTLNTHHVSWDFKVILMAFTDSEIIIVQIYIKNKQTGLESPGMAVNIS